MFLSLTQTSLGIITVIPTRAFPVLDGCCVWSQFPTASTPERTLGGWGHPHPHRVIQP